LRTVQLNKVFFVPKNESLLGILDKFQEGKSHMAIVSRFSVEQAKVVTKVAKTGLTQKLKKRVGISDNEIGPDTDTDTERNSINSTKGQDERCRLRVERIEKKMVLE
jgi:metal transporter CNNM